MSYIEKTLSVGEIVRFRGYPHWMSYIGAIGGALVSTFLIVFKTLALLSVARRTSKMINTKTFMCFMLISGAVFANFAYAQDSNPKPVVNKTLSKETVEKTSSLSEAKKRQLEKQRDAKQEREQKARLSIIIFLSIMLLIFINEIIVIYTREFVVTNTRVILRNGFFNIKTEELKNDKIESVELSQSIFGRIFGYGYIYFSGVGTSKVVFKRIKDPIRSRLEIENIISSSKK